MRRSKRYPEWVILTGGCIFIFVLALSAYWEADIRWLHFFQSWMYLAAMLLALRRNRWGYFIGIGAAAFWCYTNLFVTTFFLNGLQQLSHWIHTGHMRHADILIAVPAWFSNSLVVMGCLWAYARMPGKSLRDTGRLLLAVAATAGFFALDMALFQPRYLPLFRGALHPHWPRW
jgi:hypothetical protein